MLGVALDAPSAMDADPELAKLDIDAEPVFIQPVDVNILGLAEAPVLAWRSGVHQMTLKEVDAIAELGRAVLIDGMGNQIAAGIDRRSPERHLLVDNPDDQIIVADANIVRAADRFQATPEPHQPDRLVRAALSNPLRIERIEIEVHILKITLPTQSAVSLPQSVKPANTVRIG